MSEFVDMVKKMRELQKEYFHHRDSNVLSEAKLMEGRVDKQLNHWYGQKEIFEDDNELKLTHPTKESVLKSASEDKLI